MLWLRVVLTAVVGALLLLTPIPKQVFGKGGRAAPRWRMFSDVGTDVCVATYREGAGGEAIARFAVIEPGGSVRFPATGRLKGADTYESRTRAMCRVDAQEEALAVELYCPGRKKREETRTGVCREEG